MRRPTRLTGARCDWRRSACSRRAQVSSSVAPDDAGVSCAGVCESVVLGSARARDTVSDVSPPPSDADKITGQHMDKSSGQHVDKITGQRIVVTGDPVTIDQVVAVARGRATATLDGGVAQRMAATREVVERAVAEDRVMYGITTGFGALANTRIAASDLAEMQLALLRSHAAGVGPPLNDDVVRAL